MEVSATSFALNESPDDNVAFEVVDVLDGLFILQKRSATLEGSAPVKAVQFCTPFIQGNAAGFHLLSGSSTLLRRERHGVALGFTAEAEAKLSGEAYGRRIADVVQRGLLAKGGYWHRKLAGGPYWQRGGKLHIWTGHLIRPRAQVWILVTGAFNRRCSVDVQEYVIPAEGAWVPLIVALDLASVRQRDTWLEKEVACLVPLRPAVTFTTRTLQQSPELGRRYIEHFDQRWNGTGPGNYTGAYRKLVVGESSDDAGGPAACQLVIAGGPNLHRLRTFDRFLTELGWSRDHPGKDRLQFVDVRNIFDVEGRWDGDAIRDLVGETPHALQRLRDDWTKLYGDDGPRALERFLVGYVRSTHGPRIGEPYLTFAPWVFVSSPPGWSSLIDGAHFDGIDGMRGVISTDKYHAMFQVWQFLKPVHFEIRRGASLVRVLPVPRSLLRAGFRRVPLEETPSRWSKAAGR